MTEEKKDFFVSDISLSYQYTAGNATTRFLNKVAEGNWLLKNVQNVVLYTFHLEEAVQDVV